MNVMKEAHKQAKNLVRVRPNFSYRLALRLALIEAHKAYKAQCEASPIDWYNVTGHVVCTETGKQISVNEGSSKVATAADAILWYMNNFDKHSLRVVRHHANGFVSVEKPNTNYK